MSITEPPPTLAQILRTQDAGVTLSRRKLDELGETLAALVADNHRLTIELQEAKARLAILEPPRTPEQVARDNWNGWESIRDTGWLVGDEPT